MGLLPVPFLFRPERWSHGLIRAARPALRPCRYRRYRPVLDALWRRQPYYSAAAGAAGRFCHAGRHARLSHCRHRPARHGLYRRGTCRNARELAGRVHPKFGEFFVAAVYLAIGPCLAIPRTSSTAFEMLVPLLPEASRSARRAWCLPSASLSSRLRSRCARASSHACSAALRAPRSLRSSCWSLVLP